MGSQQMFLKQMVFDSGEYSTTNLAFNLDASESSSYGGSGTTWTNIASGGGADFTLVGATYDASEGGGSFYFDGSNDYAYSNSNYNWAGANYAHIDISFKASNTTQIHLIFEHSANWNAVDGGFGIAIHTDGGSPSANEHHSNHRTGTSANWDATVGTGWAIYGCSFSATGTGNHRKQYVNGQIVNFDTGNPYAASGDAFANAPFYIGDRFQGNPVVPSKGYIGHVRAYVQDQQFSNSWVQTNYNAVKSRYGLS